jgi:hypothetical protein
MIYAFEMPLCGMIILPCFINIRTSVQAILKFRLSNFKGCNVGITDEMAL